MAIMAWVNDMTAAGLRAQLPPESLEIKLYVVLTVSISRLLTQLTSYCYVNFPWVDI